MAWPTKKPASGMPASGMPASGAGWGGAKKGSGKGGAHHPKNPMKRNGRGGNPSDPKGVITPETAADMGRQARDPKILEVNTAKLADRIATAEELKRNLTVIAFFGEHETNRMNASN